jgi:hypothetical protein
MVAPAGVAAAALVGCATLAVVDPNEPGVYGVCPFRWATGLDCPGCGSLRAVHALVGGDLARAGDHHLLLVLALPLVAAAWVGWLVRSWRRHPASDAGSSRRSGAVRWPVVLAVVAVAFGVLRNLPWEPISRLASGAG